MFGISPGWTCNRIIAECTRSRTVSTAPATAVPKVPASERMMLNSAPPDAAFAGVIKDVVINTSGGMMKGNAHSCTSWLGGWRNEGGLI